MNVQRMYDLMKEAKYADVMLMLEQELREKAVKEAGKSVSQYKMIQKRLKKNLRQMRYRDWLGKVTIVNGDTTAVWIGDFGAVYLPVIYDDLPTDQSREVIIINRYNLITSEPGEPLKIPTLAEMKADLKLNKKVLYAYEHKKGFDCDMAIDIIEILGCKDNVKVSKIRCNDYYDFIVFECEKGKAVLSNVYCKNGVATHNDAKVIYL